MANETVLIIDADLIMHIYAAASEKRSIVAVHKSGREKAFKNRTEFKAFLEEKKFTYVPEDYEIRDVQEAAHPKIMFNMIDKQIQKMKDFCFADRVELWIGDDEKTFRQKLYLPSHYKNNREGLIRPLNLSAAKKHLKLEHSAMTKPGYETDDVVIIRSYEELNQGNTPVLSSIDKDSYQADGITLLNWNEDVWTLETIPRLGSLRKVKTAVKGEGLMFLAYQTLAGDPVDTYKPYELSNLRYGPGTAMKAIEGCKTEEELWKKVVSEYKKLYPEEFEYTDCFGIPRKADWKTMLDIYWQCAYMKRTYDDPSDFWLFTGLDESEFQ